MNRRDFLDLCVSGGAAGLAASLAGCTGSIPGLGGGEEVNPGDESFRYFFQDKTGTLGNVSEANQPPEDPDDFQVIENKLTEDQWQEHQENDVEMARDYLQGEVDRLPDHQPVDGSVEEVVQRTGEIYENPETFNSTGTRKEIFLDRFESDDDPEAFTRALIAAVDEVTAVNTSGGFDFVVPNTAEYAMEELGYDFPEYELSSTMAAEPTEVGGNTNGMMHLISTLTYGKNGNLELRYVENTRPLPNQYFWSHIRKPENSAYRVPLDIGSFDWEFEMVNGIRRKTGINPDGSVHEAQNYVAAFDYEKGKNMEEIGILSENEIDSASLGSAMEIVDDGLNDINTTRMPNEGIKTSLSPRFGRSVEDYALNPAIEKRRHMTNLGRALLTIHRHSLYQEVGGETIYGLEESLGIEGTLESPEFYHVPKEDF